MAAAGWLMAPWAEAADPAAPPGEQALRAAAFAEPRPPPAANAQACAGPAACAEEASLTRGEEGKLFAFEMRRRAELRRYRDTLDDGQSFDGMNCAIFQHHSFHICAQPPWAKRK